MMGLSDQVSRDGKASAVLSSDFYDKVFTESHMNSLADRAVRRLKENVPDLVTFNESFVDLQPWERVSLTTVVDDTDAQHDLAESYLGCVMFLFFSVLPS